jgi:hypothetical protein
MHCFASEIADLRALGFAEALPIGRAAPVRRAVARLESGRYGLAVEFLGPGADLQYSLVALDAAEQDGAGTASGTWSDVMRDIRRRAPPGDDD